MWGMGGGGAARTECMHVVASCSSRWPYYACIQGSQEAGLLTCRPSSHNLIRRRPDRAIFGHDPSIITSHNDVTSSRYAYCLETKEGPWCNWRNLQTETQASSQGFHTARSCILRIGLYCPLSVSVIIKTSEHTSQSMDNPIL